MKIYELFPPQMSSSSIFIILIGISPSLITVTESNSEIHKEMSTVSFISNETINQFTQDAMSSNENKLEQFIFLCVVYTISTLSAIVTNLIVILVYVFGHSAKTDLSIFLVNLAIADFLM